LSADNPGPSDSSNLLPELDLDEDEAASLRPALTAHARGAGSSRAPAAPPPPPSAAMRPKDLLPAQANIELDMASHAPVVARYHPAVRGVNSGAATSTAEAASQIEIENRSRAKKVANYGEVPKEFWRYGLYAYVVIGRLQVLKKEIVALRSSAENAATSYEAAVIALGNRARTHLLKSDAGGQQSLADMRKAAAPAGQKGAVAAAGATGAERANIELAFRVLDDTAAFDSGWDTYRREIDGLQRIAEERQRIVDVHELAANAHDKRAVVVGAISYIGGAILLVLLVFSPMIVRAVAPPELPALPTETRVPK
jgi:hypothetical protein